jgi:hypothetical protein
MDPLADLYSKQVLLNEDWGEPGYPAPGVPDVHTVMIRNTFVGGSQAGEDTDTYTTENSKIGVFPTDQGVSVKIETEDMIITFDVPVDRIQNGVITIDNQYVWDDKHQAYNGLNR